MGIYDGIFEWDFLCFSKVFKVFFVSFSIPFKQLENEVKCSINSCLTLIHNSRSDKIAINKAYTTPTF